MSAARGEPLINPRYLEAHHNLALVLRARGRSDQAAEQWQASLALNPEDRPAMRALLAYFGVKDPVAAARYRQMLEARGERVDAARYRQMLEARGERVDAAR